MSDSCQIFTEMSLEYSIIFYFSTGIVSRVVEIKTSKQHTAEIDVSLCVE